jgi:multifunctional 2-oxoglutarate metabolism enzyme
MGAWPRMALTLPEKLGRAVGCVSLPPSSAPAAGSATKHRTEHEGLVEAALLPGRNAGA